MDATEFRCLEPMLTRYLQEFGDCFARRDTRAHLKTYVSGQLSNLDRKSVEPIADAAGVPVRTLQEYLSQHRWDEDLVRDRLQQRVARTHPSEHSVGLIDETSFRKKGKKTPGVQRQYCGNSAEARTVEELWEHDPRLRKKPWKPWRVKDGEKGPMLWEVKCTGFYPQDDRGLPGPRHQLIIARNVLDPSEVKYFLAYAPPRTRLSTLLLVAFSRWRVERCFEDGKGEVGLSHYEGRRYRGLKRHLILSALSYLFLVEGKEALAKKKSGVDGVPSPSGDQRLHPVLVV